MVASAAELAGANVRALPLATRKEPGELLSSWLDRTAALHRVSRPHLLTLGGLQPGVASRDRRNPRG